MKRSFDKVYVEKYSLELDTCTRRRAQFLKICFESHLKQDHTEIRYCRVNNSFSNEPTQEAIQKL